MRGVRTSRWWVRTPLAVVVMAFVGLLIGAPAAQAAAPAGSLKPFVDCYWDNRDGTITVSVGVTSSNSATVSVPVGTDNRVTVGAINRGQPTDFRPGVHSNVWAATVTYGDVASGVNWSLTGSQVQLGGAVPACTQKPVPAQGNAVAVVAFGLLTTAIGSVFLSGRRRRRLGAESAGDATA